MALTHRAISPNCIHVGAAGRLRPVQRKVRRGGLAGQQARRNAHPDQARCTNSTCVVCFGEYPSFDTTPGGPREEAADAQAPWHRDVDLRERKPDPSSCRSLFDKY